MAFSEATCIDCHKGIAHELPDMTGIDPGWLPPEEVRQELGVQSTLDRDRRRLLGYLRIGATSNW